MAAEVHTRRAVQPDCQLAARAVAASDDDGDGEIVVGVEDIRRDDADPDCAERGSKRDEQIVAGERRGGRAKAIELGMAIQAGEEERSGVDRDGDLERQRGAAGVEQIGEDREGEGEHPRGEEARPRTLRCEGDDETEQIGGERDDPEQGDGCDVLAEVVGDRAEQHRGAGREKYPEE